MEKSEIVHKGILFLKSINHEYMRHVVDELNSSHVFLKFLTNDKLINAAKNFTMADDLNDVILTTPMFRVDLPSKYLGEQKKFNLPWHQESGYYPSKVSRNTSIVLNVPVFDCKKQNGCLRVKRGSHKLGYVKHEEYYEDEINKKHKRAVLSNNIFDNFEDVFAETNAGDLLINHFNTIHISGINDSDKVRYTMLIRASNVKDPEFII